MKSAGTNQAASGPLKGVKVADFTSVISGCVASVLLSDLGADVLKIESIEGDLSRWFGPFYNGECGMFLGWNRGKRGIAVDVRTEAGREIVYAIVRESDIFVENYRPGITEKLKIDYETVREINPNIIYCSISGFGSIGPDSKRPAFDPLLQNLSGLARLNARLSPCSQEACISSAAITDFGGAFLGASGILAALYHREKTGEGQRLETSLLQSAMAMQSHVFCRPLECEPVAVPGIYPYNYYETKDDLIFVAAANDKFWQLVCAGIEAPELAEDERYMTNPGRVANRLELHEKVQAYFLKKTTAEWEAILLDKGVPCAPASTAEEFFEHPQVEAMDMNPVIQHAKVGPIRMSGIPIHFDKTPGTIQRAAPTLGEHTDDVLREIGYDEGQIAQLRTEGVVA